MYLLGFLDGFFQDNSAAEKLHEVLLHILCVHLPCTAVLSPATSQTEAVGIPGPFLPALFSEAMPSYKAQRLAMFYGVTAAFVSGQLNPTSILLAAALFPTCSEPSGAAVGSMRAFFGARLQTPVFCSSDPTLI